MTIYDVTLTITNQLPVWPGDPKIVVERVEKIENGSNANVSRIDLGAHTGTHVDAPFHFLPNGSKVDEMPLDVLVGPVVVVQIPDEAGVIDAAAVKKAVIPVGSKRVLFKTRNSKLWREKGSEFDTDFVGIDKDAADELVRMGVRLVGIDYLSAAPYKHSRPTHESLLGAGMVIIEGLDLSAVEPGEYGLYCLPMKLGGADGAPARTILISGD